MRLSLIRRRLIALFFLVVLFMLLIAAYWKFSNEPGQFSENGIEGSSRKSIEKKQATTEPHLTENQHEPKLPDLKEIKRLLADGSPVERLFATRDPRLRTQMLQLEGGSKQTEAAVQRGLRWLSRHQSDDGSWSLDRFYVGNNCNCGATSRLHSDSAGTSLALLAYLGTGQTHRTGRDRTKIMKGLNWLLGHQKPNGDLRAVLDRPAGMYAHALATIVLCESLAISGDEELRAPAQNAIDFLVEAQHSSGGWRYRPEDQGDTSVTGWQLAAIQAAQTAKLLVPQETMDRAASFLDTVQNDDGERYAYQPGREATEVMTAEALLARIHLGWSIDDPRLQQGANFLLTNHLPNRKTPNIYYWYHASQLFHHIGGQPWEQWNQQTSKILIETQITTGHATGSWTPGGHYDAIGGRLYATALAICILETYYRHAPLSHTIEF